MIEIACIKPLTFERLKREIRAYDEKKVFHVFTLRQSVVD